MTPVDAGTDRLDLRLVPAAATGWSVTAAGILWQVTGLVVALIVSVVVAVAAAWWCRGRDDGVDERAVGAGVLAVAVVGTAALVRRARKKRRG